RPLTAPLCPCTPSFRPRCLSELRLAEPRARHWQARFVAHADPQAGGFDRLSALQAFIEVYLEDTDVALTSAVTHEGQARLLSFRDRKSTRLNSSHVKRS